MGCRVEGLRGKTHNFTHLHSCFTIEEGFWGPVVIGLLHFMSLKVASRGLHTYQVRELPNILIEAGRLGEFCCCEALLADESKDTDLLRDARFSAAVAHGPCKL